MYMYEHDFMVYREDRVGNEVTSSLFCPDSVSRHQ